MENPDKNNEIWAIAGGKGGTGKSFVTSSMGTCLALGGAKTILIDADYGGANLHSFLGLNRPPHSLTDFFEKKSLLKEIIVDAGVANLQLITGAIGSPDSESITHAQKQKLFRHIRALDADKILIDLGAGTHINTLDTFLLADKMIVVTTPEITALENMYQFIKSVYFRKLKSILKTYELTSSFKEIWKNRASYDIRTLKDLVLYLRQSSDHICDIFDREMSQFLIHIVLNQVRTPRDVIVGENLKSVCRNFLGIPVIFTGYARHDDAVHKNINSRESFMLLNRLSPVIKEIRTITENIAAGRQLTVEKDSVHGRFS